MVHTATVECMATEGIVQAAVPINAPRLVLRKPSIWGAEIDWSIPVRPAELLSRHDSFVEWHGPGKLKEVLCSKNYYICLFVSILAPVFEVFSFLDTCARTRERAEIGFVPQFRNGSSLQTPSRLLLQLCSHFITPSSSYIALPLRFAPGNSAPKESHSGTPPRVISPSCGQLMLSSGPAIVFRRSSTGATSVVTRLFK